MAHKKIVFVIVEGPSDDEALGLILSNIFDDKQVHVHITYGDLLTRSGTNSNNVKLKVCNEVKKYAQQTHFTSRHFQQIIHIVDMDGAYVPASAVIEDSSVERTVYSPTEIRTNRPDDIIIRNKEKSKCLDVLFSTDTIWGIPYKVYYMSSNLDHVLFDLQNASDDEKECNSIAFAHKYKDDIPGFLQFISKSDFSVNTNYLGSWTFIKEGLHSLERHSNLCIGFSA